MDRDMGAKSRRSARIGSSTLLAAASLALLAAPASAAPILTMTAPEAGARTNGPPTFSGSTSDGLDTVKVLVYKGTSAPGSPLTLESKPSGSSWSVQVPKPEALTSGSYTAVAEQSELLGLLETAETGPVTFSVDTSKPKVAITNGPESRSNETTPSFSGTASENTEVTVHVFEGLTEVASTPTTASAGKWSLTLNTPLSSGKHSFRAYATELSAIGNAPGESNAVEFAVDTEAPNVAITKGPEARSNNTAPSF